VTASRPWGTNYHNVFTPLSPGITGHEVAGAIGVVGPPPIFAYSNRPRRTLVPPIGVSDWFTKCANQRCWAEPDGNDYFSHIISLGEI
jgi:hypothetical protein